jgi:Transglycosylase SLT domain
MNVDPVASRLAAQGVAYAPQIAGAARRHGLDPELLAAVAAQETGGPGANGGRNVVGDGGHGRGLFQIDDRWHAFARSPGAMDPGRNADYAAGMLSGLLARYGGDTREALSAYNAGSPHATGTITRWGNGEELGYADSVLQHYARLTGGAPASPAPSPVQGLPSDTAASPALPDLTSLLSALSSAFGSPPMQPPTLPPQPQPYQQQVADYGGLIDNEGDA